MDDFQKGKGSTTIYSTFSNGDQLDNFDDFLEDSHSDPFNQSNNDEDIWDDFGDESDFGLKMPNKKLSLPVSDDISTGEDDFEW